MIQDKLSILKENDVITEETLQEIQKVIDYLFNKNIIEDEDEADVFLTHLAMATSREKEGENQVDFLDETIKKDIEAADEYQQAVELWADISAFISTNFPEEEKDYFYLHLVTLLRDQN